MAAARKTPRGKPPKSVEAIWQDIGGWYREHAPRLAKELRPGESADAIEEFEKAVGIKLPADYRSSLEVQGGGVTLSDFAYLPLSDVRKWWQSMTKRTASQAPADEDAGNASNKLTSQRWSREWIPFAADSAGNLLCIDLAPGPKGHVGQVIQVEPAEGVFVTKFRSFGEWLAAYRDDLRRGAYEVDEDGLLQAK
ncbi:MAG TPA: SMI1/KNR4 family protein [Chloroflexota bacterium]|nr:SMI1/KNR4 family protein [Chloroflexota bacterium]